MNEAIYSDTTLIKHLTLLQIVKFCTLDFCSSETNIRIYLVINYSDMVLMGKAAIGL